MHFAPNFRGESKCHFTVYNVLLSAVFRLLDLFHQHVVSSDYRYLNLDLLVFVIIDSFLVFIFYTFTL